MAVRYKILEELGTGGAGAVFKAYDTQLDRYVAIKRLMTKEESEKQDDKAGVLRKEAASLATLQHPNIVSVFDLGSDDEGFFMVMELVEGETLADWVKTTPMNLTDFRELGNQCLEALLSAHSQSILHRDLKPENIKIKRLPGGRIQVKVLDFGLARMSYGAKKMTEDQSGNVVGSIYYMAPEQFLRKPVDVRTDLYSMGCVFYQALSCRRPYQDTSVKGVMDAHLKHMVHPLHTVAPEVPEPICDWVMWLINAEPIHRPSNVQAALASLHEITAAGWFNENVAMAIPVVVPEGSDEGWPTTSSIPRAPTSMLVRTATGAVQRITSGQATQTHSSQTAAPPPRGPAPPRGRLVKPERKERPELEGAKMPVWVYPLAAVALLLVVAWFIWRPKKPTGSGTRKPNPTMATGGSTTTQIAGAVVDPTKRPANLLNHGYVLHYQAGRNTMDAIVPPDKIGPPVNPMDGVIRWHDIAPLAGDGFLEPFEKRRAMCPTYLVERPAGLKFAVPIARFDPGQGMVHRMDKGDERSSMYPFGDLNKGLTLIMLVRPQIRSTEVRLFRLRNQDESGSVLVRAYPNNEWKLFVKVGGAVKEAKITGRSVTQFNLVGISWSPATSKALICVRGEDGGKARTEVAVPKDPKGVLNELRISEFSSDPTKPVATQDEFTGDIVELVVWPYAMEWEDRSGQEFRIMEYYFNTPGNRY